MATQIGLTGGNHAIDRQRIAQCKQGYKFAGVQRSVSVVLSLLFVASMFAACSGHKPVPLGEIPQAKRPNPQEVVSTKAAVQQRELKQGRQIHQDCKYYVRTKRVLDNLTKAIGVPTGTWPLYMVNAGQEANAMAVNQNTIVVYEALVDRVRNDAELATIMAHEISHIVASHENDNGRGTKVAVARIGSTILGVAAVVGAAAAGMDAKASGNLGGMAAIAGGALGAGLILQYDRDQEYEADQIGMMIMAKAGYDPKAAIEFWNRAPEIFGGSGPAMSFLSTHPATDDRAEKLEEALPIAMQYYAAAPKPGNADSTAEAPKGRQKKARRS